MTPLARGPRMPGGLLLGDDFWVVLVIALVVVALAFWLARRR